MGKSNVGFILVIILVSLCVWSGLGGAKAVLEALPSQVKPGEKITLRFSGTPGNNTDWISIYPVGEKSENYGEWYYLEGKTRGELTFTAPQQEGEYEFRLFASWPEGDYKAIAVSNPVIVRKSTQEPPSSVPLYQDILRLVTGELLIGELLNFDGRIFKIKTKDAVVTKKREEVVVILLGAGVSISLPEKVISQWGSSARASSEYSSTRWSAHQATGQPDTSKCGDIATAWAPRSKGSAAEWLEINFDSPVYATKLRVHETYNSGFIYKVELVDLNQKKHTIWQGKDTTPCPGWFEISFNQTSYPVESVIIHTRIDGYEEIDAVELTGVASTTNF